MYGYLSQIINFTDIELEKSFVFLKYLNKKLPKRENERFDFTDTIDLDSLRIQKTYEKMEELEIIDTIIEPPTFAPGTKPEDELGILSEIIGQVNNTYGVNLTDEDRIDLSRLKKKLDENPDVSKYMSGNNSEENKKNYFKKQFEDMMVDYINDRFDFYKKMDDNPSMKNHIFQMMYKDYKTSSVHK